MQTWNARWQSCLFGDSLAPSLKKIRQRKLAFSANNCLIDNLRQSEFACSEQCQYTLPRTPIQAALLREWGCLPQLLALKDDKSIASCVLPWDVAIKNGKWMFNVLKVTVSVIPLRLQELGKNIFVILCLANTYVVKPSSNGLRDTVQKCSNILTGYPVVSIPMPGWSRFGTRMFSCGFLDNLV